MNNESHELNLAELNQVSGGGWADLGLSIVANAAYDYLKDHHGISDSLDYIKQQAGK